MDKPYMKVNVLRIEGIKEALLGLSLSYKKPFKNFRDEWELKRIAAKLAHKQGGHNKFLESIIFWIDVKAPRYWWAEADTYRISTKQSESTIHTLKKDIREVRKEALETCKDVYFLRSKIISLLTKKELIEPNSLTGEQLSNLLECIDCGELWRVKKFIPEGWLQRRIWCLSAKTLQNIVIQRRNHKLPHWKIFINRIEEACQDYDTDLRNWIFENKEEEK